MYLLKRVTCETVTRYYLVGDDNGWKVNSEEEAWNEFHSLDTVDHDAMEVDVDAEDEIDFSQSQAIPITPNMAHFCKENGYASAFQMHEIQKGEKNETI